MKSADDLRAAVQEKYAQVATGGSCCGPIQIEEPTTSSCCGGGRAEQIALTLGYSDDDLAVVPEGANLGLGCGNPQAIANLKPGEVVLDLGSGAGFDCFLAARQVGAAGRVIGVDMTAPMIAKARQNAAKGSFTNVEFRLGEIEHLPVADASVDVIISNCVINLSPEKQQVFAEVLRVLKPGGRLAISDMATSVPLPPAVQQDLAAYTGCLAGAASVAELQTMLEAVGFTQVRITPKESRELLQTWGTDTTLNDVLFSAVIEAVKPA